jgi:large subunit ribosomal protein L22
MKAYLRSARIAPKKANIVAKMVRGMPVGEAMVLLSRTHKKSARLIEGVLQSAIANARHNDKQHPTDLIVKTIIVNQSLGYDRGVPMARGRIRPMTKFLSHISITLGIGDGKSEKTEKMKKSEKKTASKPSQEKKNTVKTSPHSSAEQKEEGDSSSSESSTSSTSSIAS